MSVFDPSSTPNNPTNPNDKAKQLLDRVVAAAKAYPYAAIVVGAFLLLGVLSLVSALFRSPTSAPPIAASPAAVTVPAAPVTAPAAASPAAAPPAPAAGFGAPAAAAAPAVAGPIALPPQFALDAPMARGATTSLSVNTNPSHERTMNFVELSSEALSVEDAQTTFAWAGMQERFRSVWPGGGTEVEVRMHGFVRVDSPGPQTAVLTVAKAGWCALDVGPTGNRVAELNAGSPQAVTAVPLLLEAGFYSVRLTCAAGSWRRDEGMVTLALRPEGGQPRVIELWQPVAAAASPAEAPAVSPAASGT